MDYTNFEYWTHPSHQMRFVIATHNDQERKFIEKWIPQGEGKTAFEIGCVPGRYLACLGEKKYHLNGIDIIPAGIDKTKNWLIKSGYSVGNLICGSFDEFPTMPEYDLVCSFGFIEHYEQYLSVISRHLGLVKPGGMVLITTPNYQGLVQRKLHYWLDHENLMRHNINSMHPALWSSYVIEQGFEVHYANYFGYFTFWVEEADQRSALKKEIVQAIKRTLPITSRLFPTDSKAFAPYCGLVAIKRK